MILLRNIAFYVVFYLGSVIYVLSAVAVAPVSRPALGAVVGRRAARHIQADEVLAWSDLR